MIDKAIKNTVKRRLAVVKVGGDILLDDIQREGLAVNVRSLLDDNWQVIILHGGGPQVNRLQGQLGIEPNKVQGRRITSKNDLKVVKQAIAGEVNVDLVSVLTRQGVNAFGCHGASGQLIQAVKRPPMLMPEMSNEAIDFGEVGDVVGVNSALLTSLLTAGVVPVIATLGVDVSGRIFNINADTTVVKIAENMSADMLLLVTAVGAIYRDINDPASRIPAMHSKVADDYIRQKVIQGGMVPKVEEAFRLLQEGIERVVILSASKPDAFASVAKGENRYGTILH